MSCSCSSVATSRGVARRTSPPIWSRRSRRTAEQGALNTPLRPDDPTTTALLRAVAGEFRLVREIGRGGMGVVYHAVDERLERAVAIKTLPPHLASDAAVRARFLREARTAGSLSHPNIVPIYQAAERDGVVYFVMALVDGESLAERIARRGPLSTAQLLPIVRQLAVALDYAHAHGVVHRDIKAENVLLDRHEHVMVTDFGIARVAEAQPMTATGTVLGTVHYMSPEQVQGDSLDGRSDLYALGVLIFYALSGRFPFERPSAPAVLVAHVTATTPRLRSLVPDAPPPIDDVVAKLLAKSPDDRLASARDLLTALSFMSAGASIVTRDTVPVAPRPVLPSFSVRMASADAEQVWERAAELQANSGAMVRPAPFTKPAELVTRGYDASDVREAALEAGIDERYVNRALVERQAAARAASLAVIPGEAMQRPANVLLGAPSKIEFSAVIDRELLPEEYEDIADELRVVISQMVAVSAVGRTLTVNTVPVSGKGMPRSLAVTVSSRNGRTTIRAFEDASQVAAGLFGGLAAGAGVGGGTLMAALAGSVTHAAPPVIAALLTTMTAAVIGARALFIRSSRKKQEELERIVRRVGERILALPKP